MLKPDTLNCIDVIRPYVREVSADTMPSVQLLGGVGSVALREDATEIRLDEKRIIAPSGLYLSNYRDDGNLRDIETMVLSSAKQDEAAVQDCADQTIGGSLKIEVFGFQDTSRIGALAKHPLGFKAVRSFLSDRYVDPAGEAEPSRVLFPFATEICSEALETWTLEVGDDLEIPVPSPGATVLNYLTRSISGLRAKDELKVQKMAKSIFDKSPMLVDWIVDGPGSNQFNFARVLHTLREPRDNPSKLTIGEKLDVCPMPMGYLAESPMFMLSERSERTRAIALNIAGFKSRALHRLESDPRLVTLFQKYAESWVGGIIHNR